MSLRACVVIEAGGVPGRNPLLGPLASALARRAVELVTFDATTPWRRNALPDADVYLLKGDDPAVLTVGGCVSERGATCVNSLAATRRAADKPLVHATLHAARLPVPETVVAARGEDVAALAAAADRPLVVKPARGAHGLGVQFLDRGSAPGPLFGPGPWLVQDRVDGNRLVKIYGVGERCVVRSAQFSPGQVDCARARRPARPGLDRAGPGRGARLPTALLGCRPGPGAGRAGDRRRQRLPRLPQRRRRSAMGHRRGHRSSGWCHVTQRTARHGRDRTERTGSSRRLVWAITAESFFTRLGFGIVTFALPLYALRLGMSLTQIGLLIGMKAIIEPTVKPLMGRVVDRWGVRPGYLAAVLVRCVASVLLIFAATPLALFAVRALQGAASAARDPASISALTRTSRARLGRTFSLTFSARDLGNVSAGALGGGLLAVTGGEFTVLWAVVAVLAVLPVVIVWVGVPSDPGPGRPDAGDRHGASRAPDRWRPSPVPRPRPGLFRDRRLRLLCGLGLLCGLTAHMTHGLLPVLAVTVAGLSAAQIGFIYSCSVVALLLVGPLAGWVADRFGSDKLTGVRGLANAASSVTYLVFPSFAGMLCGRLIDDAGKAAFRPAWGTLLAESARRAGPRAGRVTAGLDTALSIGEALGPLLAALLWDVWGLAAYLLTRAALGIGTELLITRRLRARPIPRAAHSDLRQRPPWQRPPRTPRGHRASGQHRTAPVTTGADPGRQQADGDVTGDR